MNSRFVGFLALWMSTACSAGGTNSPGAESGAGGSVDGAGGRPLATGGSAAGGTAMVGTGGDSMIPGAGGTGNPEPPLVECDTPSIDRLQQWLASGEGPTVPATGALLISEGDDHVAKARFTSNSQWHVLAIWLGNEFGASIDLTNSTGFHLTYSATADFYIQLRPAAQWSGGAKWHIPIASTGGEEVTTFFPFDASRWVEVLGPPPHTFAAALADASGLAIVGNTTNELAFSGLRIDAYEPPCL